MMSVKRTKCGQTRRRNGSYATVGLPSEAYERIVDEADGVMEALMHNVPSEIPNDSFGCG